MDRLINFSKLVVIHVEQGQKCYGELTLRNTMHTMPVAYKLIHLSKKTRFIVHPQSGIIAPLSTTKVEIVYLLSPQTNIDESFSDCNDMFQLHSVVAPSAMAKTINSFSNTNNPVRNEWFTKTSVFIDCGIKVLLVGPQKLARLIPKGSVDGIRELLEESDPNWKLADSVDENEQTLLHLAIGQSRPDIVQLLLEFGADVEARSRSGLSPLEFAALDGEELIVELLLAHKACLERAKTSYAGPIYYASWAGHTQILRMLLHKGAQVNARAQNGETALHVAVKKQKTDCVRLLLASGANASIQINPDKETPLHIATRLGDQQMVKLLVEKGANKYVKNRFGKTAYHIALENGVTKLYDILRLGDNLCLASRGGETRVIQKLIEEGALINGSDQNKWTALHRASFKGKIEAVKALIEKGINVNATDEEGYTALHCAVETGHANVANYLLKNGADSEKKTRKGVTALQISTSLGYLSITKILEHENKQDISYSPVSYGNKEVIFGDVKKRFSKKSTSYHI